MIAVISVWEGLNVKTLKAIMHKLHTIAVLAFCHILLKMQAWSLETEMAHITEGPKLQKWL